MYSAPFKIICLTMLLVTSYLFGQDQNNPFENFGKVSQVDLDMEFYEKDPEAPAVVLFERGHNKAERRNGEVRLIKKVHRRIKVFNPDQYGDGTVEIAFYSAGSTPKRWSI